MARDLFADPTPNELRAFASREAEQQGVDPATIEAMFRQESRFNPKARSPVGAIGPAQLMPSTARELGVNPNDPYDNIRGGIRYYKQQLDRFQNPELARAAYNAGPGAVAKYNGVPPFAETQNYVRKTAPQAAAPRDLFANMEAPVPPEMAAPQQQPTQLEQPTQQPRTRTIAEQIKRQLGLTARYGLENITGTAGLVADLPYRLAHIAGIRPDLQLPSERFSQGLTQLGLPQEETTVERLVGTVSRIAAGGLDPISRLLQARLTPKPSPAIPTDVAGAEFAPAPFSRALPPPKMSEQQRAIKEGLDVGLVVSPRQSTSARGGSRILETFASRELTKQGARYKNEQIANDLVRQELGLPLDTPLTKEVLQNMRSQIHDDAYKPLENVGKFTAGKAYRTELNSIVQKYQSPNFPAADKQEIANLVDKYRRTNWDSKFILRDLQTLRNDATEAFHKGDTAIGQATKGIVRAIENNIDLNLSAAGPSRVLADFRAGRQLMAKTFDVEDIIDAGNVNLQKLGTKVDANEPLSGNLRLMGEFARAAKENVGPAGIAKPAPVNYWDMALGAGGAAYGGLPYLGLMAGRGGMRAALLSQPYQRAFISPRETLLSQFARQPAVPRVTPAGIQTAVGLARPRSPFAYEEPEEE